MVLRRLARSLGVRWTRLAAVERILGSSTMPTHCKDGCVHGCKMDAYMAGASMCEQLSAAMEQSDTSAKDSSGRMGRYAKLGAAVVGGAAVLAVTGGMAAPAILPACHLDVVIVLLHRRLSGNSGLQPQKKKKKNERKFERDPVCQHMRLREGTRASMQDQTWSRTGTPLSSNSCVLILLGVQWGGSGACNRKCACREKKFWKSSCHFFSNQEGPHRPHLARKWAPGSGTRGPWNFSSLARSYIAFASIKTAAVVPYVQRAVYNYVGKRACRGAICWTNPQG